MIQNFMFPENSEKGQFSSSLVLQKQRGLYGTKEPIKTYWNPNYDETDY